jgi:EmrB/QacA subfamily drug resistance transporter
MNPVPGAEGRDARGGFLGISRRTRTIAVIVACALFMQNLDSTVIATALPTMARAFGVDPVRMNVALTAYLLALAVFIPASGWMADRFGARTVFRASVAVFTLGSVLCGRADTLGFLIAARIVQGAGGAMMVPVGRLVLLRATPREELVAAMAWLSIPALLGPVMGPPLGGFIVTYASWRWIFDINVPVGVLGMIAVSRFIEESAEARPGRFDAIGLLLSGTALSALMFGLEFLGRGTVSPVIAAALLGGGLFAGLLYLRHARVHPAPLIDLSLLRVPGFRVALSAMMLFRAGIGAIPFLLPLMLQVGFGDSAVKSGLITFASAAGALVVKPATQAALHRFGFRNTLVWNGVISAAMVGACAAFRPAWPAAAIYAVLLVGGMFRSLQFTTYNTLAYGDVPRQKMSGATGFYAAGQQLATTIGISLGALALEATTGLAAHRAPTPWDFSVAFLVVTLVMLGAVPVAFAMPRTAGDDLAGRAPARPAAAD